jgi:hypothetical protein
VGALFLFAGYSEHALRVVFIGLLSLALITTAILIISWLARRR